MFNTTKKFKWYSFCLTILVSAVIILFALNVFPLPSFDSIVFLPPSLFFSKGMGFVNPFYAIPGNAGSSASFNYYVPLFSLLIGEISRLHTGIKTIYLICSLLGTVSIFLYTKQLNSLFYIKDGIWFRLLALTTIVYLGCYLMPTISRPEILSMLLSFLLYLLYNRRNKINYSKYNFLLCLLFALLLATQLLGFFFTFLFYLVFEFSKTKSVKKTITSNSVRIITIIAFFMLILCFSPAGLMETSRGVVHHIGFVLKRHDRSVFLYKFFWFFSYINFGFIVILLSCSFFYFKYLFIQIIDNYRVKTAILLLLNIIILVGFFRFVLYTAPIVYNATQFIFPLLIYLLTNILASKNLFEKRFFYTLNLAVFLIGAMLFVRIIVLFADYNTDGRNFDNAHKYINAIKGNKNIYITPGLWTLFDDFANVKMLNDTANHYAGVKLNKDDLLMVQNAYQPFPDRLIENCTKIYDNRSPERKKVFGLPLRHPQGFTFVVYKSSGK